MSVGAPQDRAASSARVRLFASRALRALRLVALGLLVAALPALASEPSREDRIKAAIVYKVGKFVEWPSSAFASPETPIKVCLLGEDAFADALSSMTGRSVQGRRIDFQVIELASLSQAGACHILFLPRSASGRAASVVRQLTGKPVLTISDIPGFAHSGGMISLVRAGNRIGFEIDPKAASGAGLAVRAQLLDLAEIVEP